jgi:very-short-patch-repair endonuclease
MQEFTRKTIWRRIGLIAVLLPVSLVFPFALILVGFLAWTIYEDLKPPKHATVPPPRTWRDATPEDDDWLNLFCTGCESPAEEQFLRRMVDEYKLLPSNGKLVAPGLTLEIQVKFSNYRFDFLANGRQIIEIDGTTYHSSPEQVERDRLRDAFSLKQGFKVLRIPASVVFHSPAEAVRRAKAAIAGISAYTPSESPERKAATNPIRSLSKGLDGFNRNVEAARLKQVTMTSFKSAISTEQILLEGLARQAEHEQKINAMPAGTRKNYQELLKSLEPDDTDAAPLSALCKWEKITKPTVTNDENVQRQIEAEYTRMMKERNRRILDMKMRCQKDPEFSRILCRKLVAARYPTEDMANIIPRQYLPECT